MARLTFGALAEVHEDRREHLNDARRIPVRRNDVSCGTHGVYQSVCVFISLSLSLCSYLLVPINYYVYHMLY